MGGPGVHAAPQHLPAQAALRDHALDRLAHDPLGVALERWPRLSERMPPGYPGAASTSCPPPCAARRRAWRVDDDHVVADVDVRRPGRLVLAQQRGDLGRPRPSTAPSASMTCQARSMSLGLGLNVRTGKGPPVAATETIGSEPVASKCDGPRRGHLSTRSPPTARTTPSARSRCCSTRPSIPSSTWSCSRGAA